MTKDKADIIKSVCNQLISQDIDAAKKLLLSEWPFKHIDSRRGNVSQSQQIEVFYRDNFICRYCGKRTIFIGTLRVINSLLHEEFPYQLHWKWDNTHPAFWELTSSCDHLIPVVRGGTNDSENLVTACYKCNSIKANWMLKELQWELHKPVDVKWDGLVPQFLQIMEQNPIKDKSLRSWYMLLKE